MAGPGGHCADRTPEDSPVGTPDVTPFGNSFRGFTYVAPSFLASPPASPVQGSSLLAAH